MGTHQQHQLCSCRAPTPAPQTCSQCLCARAGALQDCSTA